MLKCIILKDNLRYSKKGVSFDDFKSGGLHEKQQQQLGAFKSSHHLLEGRGKFVLRWPVAGPSGCWLLASSLEKEKD
jgi:hypothetical protein